MQAPTELDQHRNANGDQQAEQPKHETDPAKCKFAMPAHVKRVHDLDDATTGRAIRSIFGMALPDALTKFGVAKCWKMIEDYDEANKPGEVAARFAPPAEPPAPAAPETGAQAPTTNAAPVPAMVTPVATTNATSTPAEAKNGQSTPPSNIIRFPSITTLTGVPVGEISKRMNAHLPPEAYTAIKYGQMSGKTDVDGDRIRDRFEEVFGPMGIGWRITPHPSAGRVEYRSEERANKDGELKTWHIVTLVAHSLSYSVVMPDGSITWAEVSTTTDQHDNVDEQYAYRGALTSLMKQFYKLMGGMNHVMYNEYTHVQAQRDLRRTG